MISPRSLTAIDIACSVSSFVITDKRSLQVSEIWQKFMKTRSHIALAFYMVFSCLLAGGTYAAEEMVTTSDLLKNPKFKSAYVAALGTKAKDKWLATMTNSALVRKVSLAGEDYQVATPCKPHDCGDNNLLLLYAPEKGVVVGKLFEKGKTTFLGAPSPAMTIELEKLWKTEFRSQ